jgi:hypothetical protein
MPPMLRQSPWLVVTVLDTLTLQRAPPQAVLVGAAQKRRAGLSSVGYWHVCPWTRKAVSVSVSPSYKMRVTTVLTS